MTRNIEDNRNQVMKHCLTTNWCIDPEMKQIEWEKEFSCRSIIKSNQSTKTKSVH